MIKYIIDEREEFRDDRQSYYSEPKKEYAIVEQHFSKEDILLESRTLCTFKQEDKTLALLVRKLFNETMGDSSSG